MTKINEVVRQIDPDILSKISEAEEAIVKRSFNNFLTQIELHVKAFVNKVTTSDYDHLSSTLI